MTTDTFIKEFELLAETPNGIQKLREMILQLAVQGKLVPQDPNDEPVSELLARISEERSALIEQGTIKRKKALPEVAGDDAPYSLPSEWAWTRLGEIAQYGATKKVAARQIPADAWLLELEDIEKDTSRILHQFTFGERNSKSTKAHFRPADVLYGKLRPYLNKVVVADAEGFCTTEIVPVRLFAETEPFYLKVVLKSPQFIRHVNALTYGVKMPRLGTEDARMTPISLPPLAEQKRIVAKVDELMRLCDDLEARQQERNENRQKLNASCLHALTTPEPADDSRPLVSISGSNAWTRIQRNFDLLYTTPESVAELRKAILQLAVQGRLVPQNPNDEPASELLKKIANEKQHLIQQGKIKKQKPLPPIDPDKVPCDLPTGWEWARVFDCIRVLQTGPFGSSLHQRDYVTGGTPVINPMHIVDGYIQPSENTTVNAATFKKLAGFRIYAGDIVMARRGEMGRCAVASGREDGFLCGTGSLLLRTSIHTHVPFLALVLRSPGSRAYLGGEAVGATMVNLNQRILKAMPFGLPPLPEQKRIVAKVDKLMNLCDRLENVVGTSQEMGESLIRATVQQATYH